jgi:hypothetical protein
MSKTYNILWLDDEFKDEDMIQFRIRAENEGILLFGFESYEEAFDDLGDKIEYFDGILLDGLFLERKSQVKGTEDETALGSSIAKINELKSEKFFPWFVLSGKDEFTKSSNSILKANKKECFDKTNPKDLAKLFEAIKAECDDQLDTQIKHKYHKVFDAMNDLKISHESIKHFIKILKNIENPSLAMDDELFFTQLRIVVESLFRKANEFGLLHDDCVKGGQGKVNLSESSLFLAGSQTKYLGVKCQKSHFTKIISENIKSLLFITGAASHTVDADIKNNLNLHEYRADIKTPYLLYSLTFQLMDFIIWFRNYFNDNIDVNMNKSLWEPIEPLKSLHEGVIEQDIERNFHCDEFLLNYKYVESNCSIGDRIRITIADNNTNSRTMDTYKFFAQKFDKI